MTDTTNSIPIVTKEIAEARIKLNLTAAEKSIQAVLDKANGLVFNDDNIAVIKETIIGMKGVLNAIDDAHEKGKAPAWEECKAWDAAKRDLRALLAPTLTNIEGKHTKLCQAAEERKRKADADEKRKKDTLDLINTTILNFSQEITEAKTLAELISIQSRINAEQGKESTYKEYLPTLKERLIELNPLLKSQKEAIKDLGNLDAEEEAALTSGDDQKLSEIQDKKETVESRIQENKTRVQEKAINATIYSGGSATQVFPEVKAKRRIWKYNVPDLAALYKKFPDLVILTPNEDKIREILKEKIANGESKDVETMDYAGLIDFFVEKKYS